MHQDWLRRCRTWNPKPIGDEVLAVGDAAFQQKCLGKMNEVAQEANDTFVSHNRSYTGALPANNLIDDGMIAGDGDVTAVTHAYLSTLTKAHFIMSVRYDLTINKVLLKMLIEK
jgi:hypothetical protein